MRLPRLAAAPKHESDVCFNQNRPESPSLKETNATSLAVVPIPSAFATRKRDLPALSGPAGDALHRRAPPAPAAQKACGLVQRTDSRQAPALALRLVFHHAKVFRDVLFALEPGDGFLLSAEFIHELQAQSLPAREDAAIADRAQRLAREVAARAHEITEPAVAVGHRGFERGACFRRRRLHA